MLINLSNHPSVDWSKSQIQAAQRYGKIVDIAFPPVDPKILAEELVPLAKKLVELCIKEVKNSAESENAVHVMGELNLCFLVVQCLLKRNISCLASTSNRIVDDEDGIKKVVFQFEQFREYQLVT